MGDAKEEPVEVTPLVAVSRSLRNAVRGADLERCSSPATVMNCLPGGVMVRDCAGDFYRPQIDAVVPEAELRAQLRYDLCLVRYTARFLSCKFIHLVWWWFAAVYYVCFCF